MDDPFNPQAAPPQQDLASQWTSFLDDPAGRAALLSFGLQAMQPVALGQSALGHIGQSIGAAGESVGQSAAQERKEEELDIKFAGEERKAATEERQLAQGNRRLDIAERQGNERLGIARERLKQGGAGGRLTLNQMLVANRLAAQQRDAEAVRQAKEIYTAVNDITLPSTSPLKQKYAQYAGKSSAEIAAALQNDPAFNEAWSKSSRGGLRLPPQPIPAPAAADDDDDEQGDTGAEVETTQPQFEVGTIVRNPQTGQRAKWNGKAWEYL
jgi:hypothetical protein